VIQAPDYKFLVREHHLDTFGHVNNAAYFELFEEARWEILTLGGYGLVEVQKRRQGPVVLEAHLKFKKELKLREEITIKTEFMPYEGKIMRVVQRMHKPNGDIACEGLYVFGFFDLEARKLIPPSADWLKALFTDSSAEDQY